MKFYTKLEEIVPYIPYTKEGKYKGFSFVLIGGSSYKPSMFNKYNVPKNDKFYRKFNYEVEYPNINFQKTLAETTLTFAFDRPTDLLNHSLYEGDKYDFYIAKDLTVKNYAEFIKNILDYHKVKPPYVFICFSEGGYDVLTFSKYYSNLVKKIVWIDTAYLEKYILEFEEFRNGKNALRWYKNIFKNKFSWNAKNIFKIDTTQNY